MSAFNHVRDADTFSIAGISYQLDTPLGQQTGAIPSLCKKKDGPLAFTLTSEDLQLPVPNLKFPFVGTPDPTNSVITWKVDQALNEWEKGIHITRVHGAIVTAASDAVPVLGPTCDGAEERVFQSVLTTIGSDNELTVETSLGDAHARNIILGAYAGERLAPVFFRVVLSGSNWIEDGCGRRFQAPNTDVMFTAAVKDLRATGELQSIQFDWSVTSGPAHISGAKTLQTVTLRTTGTGIVFLKVRVTVTTSIHTGVLDRNFNFAVFDARGISLLRSLCRLRQQFSPIPNVVGRGVGPDFTIGGIHFVDPLWDPIRRLAMHVEDDGLRNSALDLAQLRNSTGHLSRVAGALNRDLSALLEGGEHHLELKMLLNEHEPMAPAHYSDEVT